MEAMEAGTLVAEKYRLVRPIGRGGMGAVWAAQNVRTEREVALKLITDENADYRARLLREARACGRISHRNVIEIYDVGETASGAPFLVMPLLTGEPLSRRLRRERILPPAIAAQIASDIARALAAAHAAGIVHRDLKPANIYLHQEPGADALVVKVLDFGISKVVETDTTTTTTGTILGSPAYMSPEQAKGERYVDHRSDLWSVGVTLFEMLTGRRPFQGESMFTVVAAVLGGPVPHVLEFAPHIDPALADVAAHCMERDLELRVQTAEEISFRLRPFVAGYLPLEFQSFGASGFHPAPSLAPQVATGPLSAESASLPPVHFAHASRAPQPPPAPAPRGAFESISMVTAASLVTPPPPPSQPAAPEPFSGSTTAASAMVQAEPPTQPQYALPPGFAPPPAHSRTTLWILGSVAFVSLAVFVGLAASMVVTGPAPGAAAGTTSASATTTLPPPAIPPAGSASATPSSSDSPAASAATSGSGAPRSDPSSQPPIAGTNAAAAAPPSSAGATAKATASAKPARPPVKGVGVPDDPG